jgi:2'-5' RNA ligase superfamily protein
VNAALLVPFPTVAPPLGGLPAHVTLLFPFPEPDSDVVDATRETLAGVEAFDVVFREVRFPNVPYLVPEPAEPFVALTGALVQRFLAWQPYGGKFDDVIPHLTIADADAPPPLPAHARAVEAVLYVELEADVWKPHTTFAFEES